MGFLETVFVNIKGVNYSEIEHTIVISATEIRNKIRNNEDIGNIIDKKVLGYTVKTKEMYELKKDVYDNLSCDNLLEIIEG